jgi:hypothetical protein
VSRSFVPLRAQVSRAVLQPSREREMAQVARLNSPLCRRLTARAPRPDPLAQVPCGSVVLSERTVRFALMLAVLCSGELRDSTAQRTCFGARWLVMCAHTDTCLFCCWFVCVRAVAASAGGRATLVPIAVVRQPRLHGLHPLRTGRGWNEEEACASGTQLWWDAADLYSIRCV